MFPPTLLTFILSKEIDMTQEDIKKAIRGVKRQTRVHNFSTRTKPATPEELGSWLQR